MDGRDYCRRRCCNCGCCSYRGGAVARDFRADGGTDFFNFFNFARNDNHARIGPNSYSTEYGYTELDTVGLSRDSDNALWGERRRDTVSNFLPGLGHGDCQPLGICNSNMGSEL